MADPLYTSAKALKRNAYSEFMEFLKEFQRYTVEMALGVGACPAEQLPQFAGRIAQCNALLRVFKECDQEPKAKPAAQ